MNAGAIIGEARSRAGITQTELASRMGTHQSVVARWETGRTQPSLETVARAVSATGFELQVSVSGTPTSSRTESRPPTDTDVILEMKRLHAEQAALRWIKGR